jgi:hypothetical protein
MGAATRSGAEVQEEGKGDFPGHLGAAIGAGGYYVDLRLKTRESGWPPPWLNSASLWVNVAQWGLGAWDRHLLGEGERWLDWASACGDYLVERQDADGGWSHANAYKHTYALAAGWRSAMAQGEAASLLVRLAAARSDDRYAEAARAAVAAFPEAPVAIGSLPEEYPTDPPSHVLNGAIFALWGLYDVASRLGDEAALRRFHAGVETLVAALPRWDLGWWTRYDLFPHPITNVASPRYHRLHELQLRALALVEPRPELVVAADRWARYRASHVNRSRALAQKALFRVAVPRNLTIARRLPWSPFRRR